MPRLKMLGTVRFPVNNPDFTPIIRRIKDTKPDVTFIWVPGQEQATAVLKTTRDFGLQQAGINVVSTQDLIPDEQLPLIGDVAAGLVTSGIYSTEATVPQQGIPGGMGSTVWRQGNPGISWRSGLGWDGGDI